MAELLDYYRQQGMPIADPDRPEPQRCWRSGARRIRPVVEAKLPPAPVAQSSQRFRNRASHLG